MTSSTIMLKYSTTNTLSILGFAVLIHSHIYWFYSILYIAYNKISFNKQKSKSIRRRRRRQQQSTTTIAKKVTFSPYLLRPCRTFPHHRLQNNSSLFILPTLIEVSSITVFREDPICTDTNPSSSQEGMSYNKQTRKRDKVLHLFRSTFLYPGHKHNDDNVHQKRKGHHLLLDISRKLSVNKRKDQLASSSAARPKMKLFRSLSWKKVLYI
ncbi:MAG: hypothetical protein EXX96DRAFT_582491 [Benjaminiella poitrasii]|nr:MAG: hypothetical protein EXX96DRAFT_582491 [Benjaminiella poitrasii]